jgi:hypothetical protein
MRRRELFHVLGGALAWPLAARADRPAALVVRLVHAAAASTADEVIE